MCTTNEHVQIRITLQSVPDDVGRVVDISAQYQCFRILNSCFNECSRLANIAVQSVSASTADLPNAVQVQVYNHNLRSLVAQ